MHATLEVALDPSQLKLLSRVTGWIIVDDGSLDHALLTMYKNRRTPSFFQVNIIMMLHLKTRTQNASKSKSCWLPARTFSGSVPFSPMTKATPKMLRSTPVTTITTCTTNHVWGASPLPHNCWGGMEFSQKYKKYM